ncbi:hypothetical protein [Flammeovirga aprica]|uniref:Lipoprotein n=1 Tax=Flammeovirga aprica JL-4 TaxID=694437 RepID=A0A7X9S1F6_9BACT|nr:hypothetical protein [Flammeovirga aprica]NME72648.1 hypothetical protein [Flammeovirga aprica JL-4]
MRYFLQNIAFLILSISILSSCGSQYQEDLGPEDETPDWGIPPVDSIPDVDISDKVDAKYRLIHTNRDNIVVMEYDIRENATQGAYQVVEYNKRTFEVRGIKHYAFEATVEITEDESGENKRFKFTPSNENRITQVLEKEDYECKEAIDDRAYAQLSFSTIETNQAKRINDFSFSLCSLTPEDIYELHLSIENDL